MFAIYKSSIALAISFALSLLESVKGMILPLFIVT